MASAFFLVKGCITIMLTSENTLLLVAGIESHICVYQTVKDLVKLKYAVQLITDAVSSRTLENKNIGIKKSRHAGAGITSVETALFELLGDAKRKEFKEILNIVK